MIKQSLVVVLLLLSLSSFAQKDKVIELRDLPEKALKFINSNFNKSKVSYIIKDVEDYFNYTYEVFLDNQVKVEFRKNGDWKEVDGNKKPIPTDFIPVKITSYVKRRFPNNEVVKIERGKRKYEVKISNGLELEFDLQENFLRIDS